MIGHPSETRSLRRGMPAASLQRGIKQLRGMPNNTTGLLQPLPGWSWIITFIGVLWGLTTSYPLLTSAACLALPLLASLLYIKGTPPILFACCAMQWLQVVTAVFYSDVYDTTMDIVLGYPELEKATWLSLAGIMVLAIGMRTALNAFACGPVMAARMEHKVEGLSLARLNQAWWLAFIVSSVVGTVFWKLGGAAQFATPFASIKWVFFYLLAYRVLVRDNGYGYLTSAAAVEFVSGFTGYFGSFKEVLMMFIIVVMSLPRGLSNRIRGMVVVVVVLGMVASIFWTVAKVEYRDFLQQQWRKKGGADTVTRLEGIKQLASRMDRRKMEEGFKGVVARVSYTGLFGSTLSYVPAFEPHSHGELWLGAVKHVLMPRILFPDKKVLDDSARARRFTGIRLAGAEEGTSIGIGYMAESYADFGYYGMFLPIYLLGLFMGWIYRHFCNNPHSTLFGAAIATAILFSVILAFATSNVKIVGSLTVLLLAYTAWNAFIGQGVMRWLRRA